MKKGRIYTTTQFKNNQVLIKVKDEGPGIPDELAEKIFIPGFSTKEEGHGFGLSVCQRIIKNHNGILELIKEGDKGATFKITLPLDK